MHRIWLYITLILGGIVAACSNDVASVHEDKGQSDIIDIIEITDDSSTAIIKSSSSFFRTNKTNILFSNKVEISSSSTKISSSLNNESSSSSEPTAQSSSQKKESSSSQAPPSSSSTSIPKSSASLQFYDCSKYDCITMDYLNSEVSYGELLDKRDNKVYRTIFISNHVWTAQNMNFIIATDPASSWCYGNKSGNCDNYGRLYTWEAAQKACPEGWHLPTVEDWKELLEEHSCNIEQLDDGTWVYDCAGNKLKSSDSWSDNVQKENALGFSVTGAGILFDKSTVALNEATFFWSAKDSLSQYAYAALFQDNESAVLLGLTEKENGYSVRCIKGKAE